MNLISFTKQAYSQGGGSFNLFNGTINPTDGYMVAMEGAEQKVNINIRLKDEHKIKELTNIVFRYISGIDIFDRWYNNPNAYLGLWYSDEMWYLDLSENIEGELIAIDLGNGRKQLAIWDCKNNREIRLK